MANAPKSYGQHYRGSIRTGALIAALVVAACHGDESTAPKVSADVSLGPVGTLAQEVRALAAARGIGPLVPPRPVRRELVQLGRALAFDKILSGNRNISCMTCHQPQFATGDARSLPIGAGGMGVGADRLQLSGAIIPRNSPAAFNLFAFSALFWDGRVSLDGSGYHTPAGTQLTPAMTRAFEFGATSAQGMFPVTSRAEMRGLGGNELASFADDDFQGIWGGIMGRLGKIPEYREMF